MARPNTPSDIGEWDGGRIEDINDDFAARYMFAFWRLASHGTTTIGPVAPRRTSSRQDTTASTTDRDIRIVRLTHQIPAQRTDSESTGRERVDNRRWPVRMHKVRQWYPSRQEHRVIWRGPYIKGPADAPLVMGEKASLTDSEVASEAWPGAGQRGRPEAPANPDSPALTRRRCSTRSAPRTGTRPIRPRCGSSPTHSPRGVASAIMPEHTNAAGRAVPSPASRQPACGVDASVLGDGRGR
ncbi:hypothetical protein GCM10009730_60980 [Streptomyces albidochromogenes]